MSVMRKTMVCISLLSACFQMHSFANPLGRPASHATDSEREETKMYDVVVFGATGFTGAIVTKYMAENFPGITYIITGRSKDKLEAIQKELALIGHPAAQIVVLDYAAKEGVEAVTRQARIALNFAGPFKRYGEHIVASCAKFGTDYLDITGEPVWVADMKAKYQKLAEKTGARLLSFSGFESIPSDLGVWKVLQKAKINRPTATVTQVVGLFDIKGGVGGGSFQTLLDRLKDEASEGRRFRDAALLVAEEQKPQFAFKSDTSVKYIEAAHKRLAPFFMAPISSKVVYWAQSLRKEPAFAYSEWQMPPAGKCAALDAWQTVLGLKFVNCVGRTSFGRKILTYYGPKVGEGPSLQQRDTGFVTVSIHAYSGKEEIAKAEMHIEGDPGNKATSKLFCAALGCLLFDKPEIKGGYWPPSILGELLETRLLHNGVILK